jgi:hypothetical protein
VKIFSTLKHIYVVIFILSVFVLLSIGLARTTGEEKKVSKVDDGYALLTSKDNSFDFKLTDKRNYSNANKRAVRLAVFEEKMVLAAEAIEFL